MSKLLYDRLNEAVEQRDWHAEQADMDVMADIYEGILPPEYERYFPKSVPKHLVQVIPLAWDDLATQVGRLPDLRGEPRNLTDKEQKAIGLLEKIGFSYFHAAKPTGKRFMKDLAWWLQLGRAVAIVTPDFYMQMPRLEIRDARTCYPGIKESVNNTIVELTDLTFKYKLKYDEALARGLAPVKDERSQLVEVEVIEYLDDKTWIIVSEFGNFVKADHNLGVVPGWVFQSFTPNRKAGKSRFKEQIGLMVAMSRLITAKIAFADRLVHPILWARGHEASIEVGPPQTQHGTRARPVSLAAADARLATMLVLRALNASAPASIRTRRAAPSTPY